MQFVKMHGIGNDYIYIDAFSDPGVEIAVNWPALAPVMSDRHTGIGADGIILICRPREGARGRGRDSGKTPADVRMRMFNADGSESEMCGNGVRCVAKFAHDRLGITTRPMTVQTGRGDLSIDYTVEDGALVQATVDMGAPILELAEIPVASARLLAVAPGSVGTTAARAHEHALDIDLRGERLTGVFTPVSMGNPHAVFFADANEAIFAPGLAKLELDRIGPAIEHHLAFPRRINAHFVVATSPRELTMRTWERGTGETQACGTGACAVLVAAVLTGRAEPDALLHLPGGDLRIQWQPPHEGGEGGAGHVLKTGPATEVFEGSWAPAGPRPASLSAATSATIPAATSAAAR